MLEVNPCSLCFLERVVLISWWKSSRSNIHLTILCILLNWHLISFSLGLVVEWLSLLYKVLGTPTREEIKCMNPGYTEFKFPQLKARPWHKVKRIMSSQIQLSPIRFTPSPFGGSRFKPWEVFPDCFDLYTAYIISLKWLVACPLLCYKTRRRKSC